VIICLTKAFLSFLYFKLKISKNRIIYIIISTLIVIAVGIGLTFPIENLWKTFKTVEDAFNYKYPEYDIIKKYEGQKLTIVLVNNDNNLYLKDSLEIITLESIKFLILKML